MLGAIIGDVIASRFQFKLNKSKKVLLSGWGKGFDLIETSAQCSTVLKHF